MIFGHEWSRRTLAALALGMICVTTYAARPALEPYRYREDFESRTLRAWASYPLWQDTAYDPNFRIDAIVPGDPNISVVQRVTPYSPVDNYLGAQKLFDAWLEPSDTIRLRYYIKSNRPAEYLKVRLAAGPDGAVDFTVDHPRLNQWQWVTARFEDFARQNPALARREALKLNALAVLVKIPDADPAMPLYLGLDDVDMSAHRPATFRFAEPATEKLAEWPQYIATAAYRRGQTLKLSGSWPCEADAVNLAIFPLTQPDKPVIEGQLRKHGNAWSLDPLKLDLAENLYVGCLTAMKNGRPAATTELTLHVAPAGLAGRHPRLWFDEAGRRSLVEKLGKPEFVHIRDEITSRAAQERAGLKIETLIHDLDQYPDEDWLPSWAAWGSHIYGSQDPLYWNALAYALAGDRQAGVYAKDILVKLAGWPNWTHPWQTKRGRFSEHRSGNWAHFLALGYDLTYDLMTPAESEKVREAFRRNLLDGVHTTYVVNNNVTCQSSNWIAHVAGGSLMTQAAIWGDGPARPRDEVELAGAALKLRTFLASVTDPAGAWGEGLGYNEYSFRSLTMSLPSIERVFGMDMTAPLRPIYKEYIWAGPVSARQYFHFGDTGGHLGPIDSWAFLLDKYREPLLGWLYNFLKDSELRSNSSDSIRSYMSRTVRRNSLNDLLYETRNVPMEEPFKLNPVKLFPEVGTTVFKSGWGADDFIFVMHSGAFYNHQHLDQGTFWLADRGETFVTERHGSSYYDDPLYQSHYTQPIGHSTILIDHNPQSQRVGDPLRMAEGFDERAFTTDFLDGGRAAFVCGDIGRLYWGKVKSLRRNVLYLKPRTLLMLDVAEPAAGDVDVTLLYQAERLDDITTAATHSTIRRGRAALDVLHLAPAGARIDKVETPHYLNVLREDRPLVREGMLTVSGRTQGRPLVMANLLTTTGSAVATRSGDGWIAGTASGSNFAFSLRPGSVYTVDGLKTDALAAAWGGDWVLAAKTTELSRDGAVLVQSSRPGTFECSGAAIKYTLSQPARLTFATAGRPGTILLDGRPTDTQIDAQRNTASIDVPAGTGTIGFAQR